MLQQPQGDGPQAHGRGTSRGRACSKGRSGLASGDAAWSILLVCAAALGVSAADAQSTGESSTREPAPGETRSRAAEIGETACSFAGRLGVDPTVLLQLNGLDGPIDAPLPTDRPLRVPTDRPARYQLRPGDTLSAIATHFGLTVTAIARENDLADANRLRVGMWLELPPGARTACPPGTTGASVPSAASPPSATSRGDEAAPSPAATSREDEAAPSLVATSRADEATPSPPARLAAGDRREVLAHAATVIRAAEALYREADFPTALALTGVARHLLDPLARSEEVDRLDARAAWVSGLTLVGLGRSEEAVESFRTALGHDRSLASSPGLSPKVTALLERARSQRP